LQCEPHWRAAGVPTGTDEQGSPHYMGYSSLDAGVTQAVGDAIVQIDRLLATKRFASLAFSWNDDTMHNLRESHNTPSTRLVTQINKSLFLL
jgi:hypothetical protein